MIVEIIWESVVTQMENKRTCSDLREIHRAAAIAHLPWSDVIEINHALQQFAIESLRRGNDASFRAVVGVVSNAMLLNLAHNVPLVPPALPCPALPRVPGWRGCCIPGVCVY